MKHLLKFKTFSLAALILVSFLMSSVACSSADESQSENTDSENMSESDTGIDSPEVEETKFVSDDLGDVKFDGYTYTVLYRDENEHLREITADELTGDIINDAVFQRTQSVEERFGITLVLLPVGEGSLNNTFSNSVSAGDHSFDIAFQHMILTASLAAGGVTVNWYDVPNLNFEKPWWTSSVKELTVNKIMYVTASDYCLNTFEMAWCLVFNKQMLEDIGIEASPYDLVKNGKWTIDNYYDMVKDVSFDLDGDSKMTINDRYGINSYGNPWLASISNYWWACGETISKFDDSGNPYFAMDSEKTQDIFDKMYKLLVENDISYWDTTSGNDMIFWKNQSLFASMMVRDVEVNRDKDLEYGLVPYPKYDENQKEHLTLVDGHASVMCIPVTLNDEQLNFVGAMVEAFSAETYNNIMPAYYETAMQVKFAQDETFPEMLEIVKNGRVFNFGYVYDIAINRDILVNLITSKNTALASKVTASKKVTENYYEKVTATFSE